VRFVLTALIAQSSLLRAVETGAAGQPEKQKDRCPKGERRRSA
jgi:hypothetical protein